MIHHKGLEPRLQPPLLHDDESQVFAALMGAGQTVLRKREIDPIARMSLWKNSERVYRYTFIDDSVDVAHAVRFLPILLTMDGPEGQMATVGALATISNYLTLTKGLVATLMPVVNSLQGDAGLEPGEANETKELWSAWLPVLIKFDLQSRDTGFLTNPARDIADNIIGLMLATESPSLYKPLNANLRSSILANAQESKVVIDENWLRPVSVFSVPSTVSKIFFWEDRPSAYVDAGDALTRLGGHATLRTALGLGRGSVGWCNAMCTERLKAGTFTPDAVSSTSWVIGSLTRRPREDADMPVLIGRLMAEGLLPNMRRCVAIPSSMIMQRDYNLDYQILGGVGARGLASDPVIEKCLSVIKDAVILKNKMIIAALRLLL